MYNSLLDWAVTPCSIRSMTGRTGTGAKVFSDAVDATCYVESKQQVVVDATGVDTTSTTALYMTGSVAVTAYDEVTFLGRTKEVIGIDEYFDRGQPSIKVVYV